MRQQSSENMRWSPTMQQHKFKTLQILPILLFIASLAGCSSSAKIRSDYDPGADFASYKTWDFIEDAGPDHEGYESLFSQYMVTAITLEMDKRGYVRSDNPDLLVNFNAYIQEKTKVTTSPSMAPMGGYYGYRGAHYGAWGGYGYGTDTHVSQYTEGTYNIDLVDAREHQLVWEAVGVGRITEKKLNNLQQGVMEGVPNFFAQYPFVAGSGTPVQQ
ncbi:MAG: DUF4136 domain-containing protein [Gammaproteobacteria bacterium]|nr:MAG: DUF4136 domain-containing protein [Gammaproteobacteria bacterium]RLA37515.1 MAG: DUF4136 domain-containing protein [Gammaproteobacteria bacterium]